MLIIGSRRKWEGKRPPLGVPFQMNRASWQSHNLVGWWPHVHGNVGLHLRDYSGRGHHMTEQGSSVWALEPEMGWTWDNDYSDGYREVAHHPDFNFTDSDEFTLVTWLRMQGTPSGWPGLLIKGQSTTQNWSILNRSGTREIYFTHYNGGWDDVGNNLLAKDDEWSFVAIRKVGANTITVVVDDSDYTASKSRVLSTTSNALRMGRSAIGTNNLNAIQGDTRIYRWAMSDEQIEALRTYDRWGLYQTSVTHPWPETAAAPTGRIMSSLADMGGLAGRGGLAGEGGGLAA